LARQGARRDKAQQDKCNRRAQGEGEGPLADKLKNIEADPNCQRDQEDHDYRAEQNG